MADNPGPMAWLFLPENVQVQYLQKIALRAENKADPMRSSFFRERHSIKEGENGSGTGINSRAGLPENEQVQYLHKIALRA